MDGGIYSFAVFDDGAGPAIYAGGEFRIANDVQADGIAKWNGSSWSAVGTGINGDVYALTVFDDGTGPALYAGGEFSTAGGILATDVAKWNGSSWSGLGSGMNGPVTALTAFDDGTGAALYAGGGFTVAGGTSANYIARWNASSWSPLLTDVDNIVSDLIVFDDGTGAALCATGDFTMAGGMNANRIAKWNGSSWSAFGGGLAVAAKLGVFDDGSGPSLYAGKWISASAPDLLKWDGTNWIVLNTGSSSDVVSALTVFDDGTGPALHIGGVFGVMGGIIASSLAKWDGTTWTALGSGVNAQVAALAPFDDGTGPALYLGGFFTKAGGVGANRVARLDGTSYSALGAGQGMNGGVYALAAFQSGPAPKLCAGGYFTNAGDLVVNRVTAWNGVAWSGLGGTPDGHLDSLVYVDALERFDGGGGPEVYGGGRFLSMDGVAVNNIARWNGTTWSGLGSGVNGRVESLAVFDDGATSQLYAGGQFTIAGGVPAIAIARWNGSTWSAAGTVNLGGPVHALKAFDDGTGAALYAGGFSVKRWNGSTWSALPGSNMVFNVQVLCVFDDGAGPALYAGGEFDAFGGQGVANHIAKWNGSSWLPLASGTNGVVRALTVFDDGGGPALYAGGDFTLAGGVSANRAAKWNGSSWSALGSGTDGSVRAFAVADPEADGVQDLYLGGLFTTAGGKPASNIAKWSSCGPGLPYCFGDGLDPVVTAQCPCANFGEPGRGCANSDVLLGGARLSATGSKMPNTVLLTCDGIPNGNLSTFLRNATNIPAGGTFGDGVKCAIGTLVRFGQQTAGLGGNPSNTVSIGAASVAPGNTRYYHVQYRNPAPGFCTPELFNGSNGFVIQW